MNYNSKSVQALEGLLMVLVELKVVPNSFVFLFTQISTRDEWMGIVCNYCEKFQELKRTKDALNHLRLSHRPILAPELLELKYKCQSPSSFEVDSS